MQAHVCDAHEIVLSMPSEPGPGAGIAADLIVLAEGSLLEFLWPG